jgi:hypothetical protein
MASVLLKLYAIFHLNLCYSSVAEHDRKKVIKKCYWPILDIAEDLKIPIAIEVSGCTLKLINAIDPNWIKKMRSLLKGKRIELIGSGYSQIIGPLVPAKVNECNQRLVLEVYIKILGKKPKIALVNEQAYSMGLIKHYIDAGYKAIIMEWNNPYSCHLEWNRQWQYYPQRVYDNCGNSIPIIWNNAISFQKFQRYAHGEIEIDEYMEYLEGNLSKTERIFPIYGNDAEVFDFRPGRFNTEEKIHSEGEWERIKSLFLQLKKDNRFEFILPSRILKYLKYPLANNSLVLQSSQQPIPVKKQGKYNITRWAVTGKDDTNINTKCYRIYDYLHNSKKTTKDKKKIDILWKKLCYLWGSDFRTHITKKRWIVFCKELNITLKETKNLFLRQHKLIFKKTISRNNNLQHKIKIEKQDSKIKVETDKIDVVLNTKKGLTIYGLIFKEVFPNSLVGTILHGYYEDIGYGADYFTGHTVIEESGKAKVTDLQEVKPDIIKNYKKGYVSITALIKFNLGSIKKEIRVFLCEAKIEICYTFNINLENPASVRTGIFTFLPRSFKSNSLYYKTTNGGNIEEKFGIKGVIDHGKPVNRLISANNCLGATDGWVEIGDRHKYIRISTDKTLIYNVPMIEFRKISPTYFLRCCHSIKETDETSVSGQKIKNKMKIAITAGKHNEKDSSD